MGSAIERIGTVETEQRAAAEQAERERDQREADAYGREQDRLYEEEQQRLWASPEFQAAHRREALAALIASVQRLPDGRWMIAHWNRYHQQWQSSDRARIPESERHSYCYSYGATLAALAGVGIRTYRCRSKALRAAAHGDPDGVLDEAIRTRPVDSD